MTVRDTGRRAEAAEEGVEEPSSGHETGKRPPRALGIGIAVAASGLILDQGTKTLATTQLQPGTRVPLIGDLLGLSLVYNPGAAFSVGSGSTWIFTVVGVLAAAVVIGFAVRLRGIRWGIALGLILGGAVGNLIDRLVNQPSFGQGHVTDFIAYGDLFVGNVADVLVVVGVGLACVILFTSGWKPDHLPSACTTRAKGPSR
jgi:Lipoprotein signal peptidase